MAEGNFGKEASGGGGGGGLSGVLEICLGLVENAFILLGEDEQPVVLCRVAFRDGSCEEIPLSQVRKFDCGQVLFGSAAIAPEITLKPYTLYPTPYTLKPTPYTLHPTPKALHPTPKALNPKPQILNPPPFPLNPQPSRLFEGLERGNSALVGPVRASDIYIYMVYWNSYAVFKPLKYTL